MKFAMKKDTLIDNLQKVLGPAMSNHNLTILGSVLITVTDLIEFTTTDLDISIATTDKAKIEATGQVAIPMQRFFSIIKELPAGEVKIERVKHSLSISCVNVKFKISTLDEDEFPKIKKEKGATPIKINPADLEEMIQLTSFCVGREDDNYILGGLLFVIEGNKINLVATDGKRLAVIEKRLPATQPAIKNKMSFILPLKATMELYKLIKGTTEDIYMFVEENKVGIDYKTTQFTARPMEGEYPDYEKYIPAVSNNKLTINRVSLLNAIRRASLLYTVDYQGVNLKLKKSNIVISKNTPQIGEVKEEIKAKYVGEELEIGFNPNYLIDVLKELNDDNVCIDFSSADRPAVLRKEGYTCMILPLRV